MDNFDIALKKQRQEIDELKDCTIFAYKGFGKKVILSFTEPLQYPDGECGAEVTQKKIDEGYYESLQDFDSYHTSDIEFIDLYSGDQVDDYRERTQTILIELGKVWKSRISNEFPGANMTIVVHKEDDEWYLDTFNHKVEIEGAIFI